MDIEFVTDLLMQKFLSQIDPQRGGGFIEIGLGSGNFSFTWAQPLGFECYAVEPLPTGALKEQVLKHQVVLTEAAITDISGEVQIYIGSLNGSTLSDISSLHADWWGGGMEEKTVTSLTIKDYVAQKKIQEISSLKIDTEGAELSVISGLKALEPWQLPQLIAFEYGGGGSRKNKEGGWLPKFFENTLDCLKTLKCLGYETAIVIEQKANQILPYDLVSIRDMEDIFSPHAEVGNIICTRNGLTSDFVSRQINSLRFRVLANATANQISKVVHIVRYYIKRYYNGILRRLVRQS